MPKPGHWTEQDAGSVFLNSYYLDVFRAWVAIGDASDVVEWGKQNPHLDDIIRKTTRYIL